MINEIAMVLMFAMLFVLVLSAVIVGSRMGKAPTRPAPEKEEEPPKEPPKTQEFLPEESPRMEEGQPPSSVDVYEEEQRLYMPEPEFFEPEQTVEITEPWLEAPETEAELSEPTVEFTEPEIEPVPETYKIEAEASVPEAISPEPLYLETPRAEEPVVAEPREDTYREPDYFRDEDVIPVQGVTTCPHCGEKVPSTLYCINCGKSLNE